MSEIVLVDSLLEIHPKVDIQARGIELLTVDVENVLTDYGNPELLPGIAEHMEEIIGINGLSLALITNKTNDIFLHKVTKQLPGNIVYLRPDKEKGINKKPSPDMFRLASDIFTVDPSRSAHVDDQIKAWWGSNHKTGFGTFFWTKPIGQHQHGGVRVVRPLEFGIIRPAISLSIGLGELRRGDL